MKIKEQLITPNTLLKDAQIFAEAFGFSSLVRDGSNAAPLLPVAKEAIIHFSKSQLEQAWSPEEGTLLEFAESHGLIPEYGCRSGQCGSCKVKLLSGKTTYKQPINCVLDDNEILLCCAVPMMIEGKDVSHLEIEL